MTMTIQNAAIREQIVDMAAKVVAAETFLEHTAMMLSTADANAAASASAGASTASSSQQHRAQVHLVALLKYSSSRTLEAVVSAASSILGAAALVRGGRGPGARIERIRRDAHVNAAAGGGSHTLLEFVAKQAKL